MTFPQSAFPRTEFDGTPCSSHRRDRFYKSIGLPNCDRCKSWHCALPYYRHEQAHYEKSEHRDCFVHSPPRDFPILRASPRWQQTWISYGRNGWTFGYWFPPLYCHSQSQRRAPGLPSQAYVMEAEQNRWLERLYTVDNCAECVAALQAVELMVYGVARFLADEPAQWEHRCYFDIDRDHVCSCGRTWWWLSRQLFMVGAEILREQLGWRHYTVYDRFITEAGTSNDGISFSMRAWVNEVVDGPLVIDPD